VETEHAQDARATAGQESFSEKHLLDDVERFRRERDSGREVYSILTPQEWEVMQIYDENHDAYRRSFQVRMLHGFEMIQALMTRQ
jgi:hypothetical protein